MSATRCYLWREVGTDRRVCLMAHAHPRPAPLVTVRRRPMVSRPSRVRLPWRRIGRGARAAQQRQGPVCTMGAALELMLPGYRAEVTSALRTPGINATTIATLLQADGYEVKADAVRRHRIRILGGQGCGCPVA